MRPEDLFAIDVEAELDSLCSAQIQGPWQVPAELVRLAEAREAAKIEIGRFRTGFRVCCDGLLADPSELRRLEVAFDPRSDLRSRQRAVSGIEKAGLSALLWAAGLPGAVLCLTTSSVSGGASLEAQGGRVRVVEERPGSGPPRTEIVWRCRKLSRRRALAWVRTAARFVPVPVEVDGRPLERGFRGALYRMRIVEPLPAELAVTADGDAATLWLLEHGVLSTRAVVPGYPPFSAALEMGGVVTPGASADELRTAANPFLPRLIDEAARMAVQLASRLPGVDPAVRVRLTTLLLGFAGQGVRRDEIVDLPVLRVRSGSRRGFASPNSLAAWASRHGGVIRVADSDDGRATGPLLVEATAEESELLADLTGLPVEPVGGRLGASVVRKLKARLRQLAAGFRARVGPSALGVDRLTGDERRLVEASAAAGRRVELVAGSSRPRPSIATLSIGRKRPEVREACAAVAEDPDWLYPSLLAMGDGTEIPDELRRRWLEGFRLEDASVLDSEITE